jgi:hypothetical protein
MCNILLVTCSTENATSTLKHAVGDAIAALHEYSRHCTIRERHLYEGAVPPLTDAALSALKTVPSRRSLEQCRATALSDILLKEVREADVLLLAAPMRAGVLPEELIHWCNHVGGAAEAVHDRIIQTKIAIFIVEAGQELEPDASRLASALQIRLAPAGISEVALVEPGPDGYPIRHAPFMMIASRSPVPLH